MKFPRRNNEITPPYIPMADIAFNLVLFFLILAKTQDDSNIQWTAAKATGLKPAPNSQVVVAVDKDNKIYLNNHQVGLRELADGIGKELGSKPATDRAVLLKIDKSTLAATFEPIMEAVSQAGGEVVHVLEEER